MGTVWITVEELWLLTIEMHMLLMQAHWTIIVYPVHQRGEASSWQDVLYTIYTYSIFHALTQSQFCECAFYLSPSLAYCCLNRQCILVSGDEPFSWQNLTRIRFSQIKAPALKVSLVACSGTKSAKLRRRCPCFVCHLRLREMMDYRRTKFPRQVSPEREALTLLFLWKSGGAGIRGF